MFLQGRYLFAIIFLSITGFVGRKMYLYYFDTTPPVVTIQGFEDEKGYSGDVQGSIKGSSKYKISHVSMWLDGTAMHEEFKVNRKQFDHPISIPCKSITDGRHTIKFEVVDATKNKNITVVEKTFYTDNLPLQASLVPLNSASKASQGRCLYIQLQVNKPVRSAIINILQNQYKFFPEYKNSSILEAIVPIECEQEPGDYPYTVEVIDYLGASLILEGKMHVISFPFKRKNLNITGNKLQTELEFTKLQEQDLEEIMDKLAKASSGEKLWTGVFEVPIAMKGITTDFGVIRTSQERGRKVHKALDLVADPKSVIWSSNNGIVVLKDRFTHTGNTVVVDHGCGILSLYCHLLDYADNIQVGQRIKKGHPLGRMGMTGYASGDHLHWEIRVNNVAVEPMQWTQRWN
ncbi:M23 family metallopeptidase [Candidatus Dependentiae bacterium]|nr:M23 family metallopeptidase [Candidatus Dependentiae bacterium]